MILVDSGVWIDFFNGAPTREAERLDALLGVAHICVGDLILTEVLQGFRSETAFRAAREAMAELPCIAIADRDAALHAALNFRRLRSIGITVYKTIDTLIATRCLLDDHSLLFSDRDFDPFVRHLGLRSERIDS